MRTERAARALLLTLCLAASLYALLCSIPFTWQQFIHTRFYPRPVELLFQGWGALLALAAFLGARALPGKTAAAWGGLHAALGAAALLMGFPLRLDPASPNLFWSFIAWAPWLSWELLLGKARALPLWSAAPARGERRLCALLGAAALVWAATLFPHLKASGPAAWAASLAAHLLAGTALYACLGLFASPRRPLLETGLTLLCAWAATAAFIKNSFLASLSFVEAAAWAWSGWTAAALILALAADAWSLQGEEPLEDAAASLLRPLLGPLARRSRAPWALAAALAAYAALPAALALILGGQDWNRLVETFAAWLSAAGALAALLHAPLPRPAKPRAAPALAAAMTALLCAAGWAAWHKDPELRLEGRSVFAAMEPLSCAQSSLRALRLALQRPAGDEAALYAFLQANTNIPRTRPGKPAEIRLVETLAPPSARKPHVFLFVIDSLRRDYLGVYNPKIRFTPAFDALAADAWVFKNAFTAYGGTGLSEPSIWSGSLQAHQQYVLPFKPMNSLERLLDHEGYAKAVTQDQVLEVLLAPDAARIPLDAQKPGYYDFCGILDLLSARLPGLKAAGKPLFVYTQPQDIHISVINREGDKNVTGKPYPGLHVPYASRVEKLDACFGKFLTHLKAEGLYEDSLIVLTADHGDSLGEGGRFGHAYTIYPEVMRIPLILRPPAWLKEGRAWNPDAFAMSLDIAPTLYQLLGHGPPLLGPLLGRPLTAPDAQTLADWSRVEQFVASSYAPVYGLLSQGGRRLYIVDAVNHQRRVFDLVRGSGPEGESADEKTAQDADAAIRRHIEQLNALFGL